MRLKHGSRESKQLEELWKGRFAELSHDCGNELSPGMDEVEEWREWHQRPTTPDQLRIEDYLESQHLSGLSILHVGVGNSSLARRFSGRANLIVGITLSPSEAQYGASLGLPNYLVGTHNKYSNEKPVLETLFDVIVDNNPTAFGCCRRHFEAMMSWYKKSLKPSGTILTDSVGLGWVVSTPGANPRWRFSFEDWSAVGGVFNLEATKLTDTVYALRHVVDVQATEKWYSQILGFSFRRATQTD